VPVVQLGQDQEGPAGGIASILGLAGGFVAANAAKKRQQEQTQYDRQRNTIEDARKDKAAQLYAQNVQSEMAARNATTTRDADTDAYTKLQRGLFGKYSALVNAGPPKGVDPRQWAASLQSRANADGLTDETFRNQLISDGQAVVAARAPKLSQVEHGLAQPVTSGKGAWAPQQMSQHWLQAGARVMNSDMPDDQKKLIVGQFQKMAADALSSQTDAERERHDKAMEANQGRAIDTRVIIAGMPPRGGRGGGSGNSGLSNRAQAVENNALTQPDVKGALRVLEKSNLPRKDRADVRQDIMDQFREPAAHDTSGLSAGGALNYNRDHNDWYTAGADPSTEPDPNNPKYQRKSAAMGAGGARPAGGGASAPAPAAAPAAPTSSGKSVSLKAAMGLPQNRGKTPAQVQADIQSHGYAVTP